MICWKVDVFEKMKENGFNLTKIERDNLLSGQTMANIRRGKNITLETLNKLCLMCRCQPGDLIYEEHTREEIKKYYNM